MPTDLFGGKVPPPVIDYSAPFWCGDNADVVIAKRLVDRATEAALKVSRRSSGRPASGDPATQLQRTIRRIERNIPKRKTLAARQRLQAQLKELKQQLEKESE